MQNLQDVPTIQTKPKSYKKRIIIGFAILIPLLLFTVWWSATVMGERAIQAQLAEYRAAGEMVDLKDFRPPPTPDEDNAALALQRAGEALTIDEDDNEHFAYEFDRQVIAENLSEFSQLIRDNRKVLELLDAASRMSGVDWGMEWAEPIWDIMLPELQKSRNVIKFAGSVSLYHHLHDDDGVALELLADSLSAADTVRKCPLLIPQLVAMAEDSIVASVIEQISYDLTVTAAISSDPDAKGQASRQQMKSLIKRLLTMEANRQGMIEAFYAERVFLLSIARVFEGTEGSGEDMEFFGVPSNAIALACVLSPFIKHDTAGALEYMTKYVRAAEQDNYSDANALLPIDDIEPGIPYAIMHPVSVIFLPALNRAVVLDFRGRARRVMAATALAIRLYEIDHGRRPAKLADLVPDYLDAVPDDPFAAAGTPIGYLPDAPRPLLYSINGNCIDQGGQYAADPNDTPRSGGDDYDLPFFLNGDRPKPPPEEPEEGESEEELFDQEQSDEESATQPASAPTSN